MDKKFSEIQHPILYKRFESKKIFKLTDEFLKARNFRLILLGNENHRQALGISGHIPEGPFLVHKSDVDMLFTPLKVAIQKHKNSKEFKTVQKIAPDTHRAPTQRFRPKAIAKKNSLLTSRSKSEEAKIKRAKASETFYEKITPGTHDFGHLQTIQNDYEMLQLFNTFIESGEYPASLMNKTRELWCKAFKYIFENWSEWQAYRDGGNYSQKFTKGLYDILEYPPKDRRRRKFRNGTYREMSNFVISCYVIPVSMLSNNPQTDLFKD